LGFIVYSIYQLLPAQADNPTLKAIAPTYIVSCIANCVWLVLWQFRQLPYTIVFMIVILVSLLVVYMKLNIGKGHVAGGMRWLVHVPFSIYLGWISVATIANVSALLSTPNGLSWTGWGVSPVAWTIIVMAVAMLLALLMAATRQDTAYDLVIIWALVGIGVNQFIKASANIANSLIVAIIAFVFAGVIFVAWALVLAVQPGKNKLA
jgi:hypothetical protein